MRYAGGKEKIAKPISEQLLALRRPEHDTYIEPFCGGCNILSVMAPHFERVVGADLSPDLILMWQALQTGWLPPATLTEAEYEALRFAEPSALRGFVGFGCSFGGKWFAGFVGIKNQKIVDATQRAVIRQSQTMQTVRFIHTDYRSLLKVSPRSLIYCDPPYYATTGYGSNARHFDSAELWSHVRTWSAQGATVAVSEYQAPPGFTELWSGSKLQTLALAADRKSVTDRLFLVPA